MEDSVPSDVNDAALYLELSIAIGLSPSYVCLGP